MNSSNTQTIPSTELTSTSNGSKIKGIIFDFDGVISSFQVRIGWPIVSAALMVKPDITDQQIADASLEGFTMLNTLEKQPNKTSLFKFAFNMGKRFGMTNFQSLKFVITTAIIYAKNRKTIVPTIGVREVLREILAQDYKLVLLTNSSKQVINIAKEKIPEIKEFDLVLTRDDVKLIKPNATGMFKAMKILDLKADEVISIGDQASDVIAGKRAGTLTVAMNEKIMKFVKPHLQEQNPDFIIRDLRQLPNLLIFLRDCIIEDLRTTIDLTEKSIQELMIESDLMVQPGS
ncbi:MAG: HAD-IA family hydrolase [Candidatus Heimdallarchaeota archaeon]